MVSYSCERHHRWRTQAPWTNKFLPIACAFFHHMCGTIKLYLNTKMAATFPPSPSPPTMGTARPSMYNSDRAFTEELGQEVLQLESDMVRVVLSGLKSP